MNKQDRKILKHIAQQLEPIKNELEELECSLENRANNLGEKFPNKREILEYEVEEIYEMKDFIEQIIDKITEYNEENQ